MTSQHQMNREELIELAALDAYGLLDQYDAAIYTRSLLDASAAVQDEVRQLQAAIALDESLLPDDMPPAELRGQVLGAVRRAIEQEASRLAPIATIGRRPAAAAGAVATAPAVAPARLSRLGRLVFGGQSPMWRAASFALAGALVALFLSYGRALSYNEQITRAAIQQRDLDWLGPQVPALRDYFMADTESVLLREISPRGQDKAFARVYWLEGESAAMLMIDGLPTSDEQTGAELTYEIAVTDAAGVRHRLSTFVSRGTLQTERLALAGIALATNSVWTISTASGTVLSSAV
jgi:hypothetical protein